MSKFIEKRIHLYVIADYCTALLTWFCFFVFRKHFIETNPYSFREIFQSERLYIGLLFVPIFWILFYYLANSYNNLLKKSRLLEIYKTIAHTFFGSILLFFTLMLDDIIKAYSDYYQLFFVFFGMQCVFTIFGRYMVLHYIKNQLIAGNLSIPTILIGTVATCKQIEQELHASTVKLPYNIVQKIEVTNDVKNIENYNIQTEHYSDVILALPNQLGISIDAWIVYFLNKEKTVQLLPDELDVLSGKFKTQSVFGTQLIEIPTALMTPWEKHSKRCVDIFLSFCGLIFLLPFFAFIAYKIKRTTKGSIFFRQERIGLNGKTFSIIKFRSMIENAEDGNPMLSSENDPRITSFGKVMRKYRIDELPQLWNVLKGDMSLVGPRPERAYYIQKIIQIAPQYQLLHRVPPGITSLGMVKFGYASNIAEMLQRMRYDLLYIENISVLMDIKILLYTVITLWKGKGK